MTHRRTQIHAYAQAQIEAHTIGTHLVPIVERIILNINELV